MTLVSEKSVVISTPTLFHFQYFTYRDQNIVCYFSHDLRHKRGNQTIMYDILRPFVYERVYLSLCEVADTPFHIQGDDLFW